MSRLVEVRVPDMGSFSDVAVIDVLVKPGESIEREASLVTLETEKATMDVPSDVSSVVEKVHVQKGGKVSAGAVVATVRVDGEAAGDSAPAGAATATSSNGAAAGGVEAPSGALSASSGTAQPVAASHSSSTTTSSQP